MLNSGMQIYWLKMTKPEIYSKIKYSLHLPQYISYVFTGVPLSEYTSIGSHTGLWDYDKKDYHDWVYKEQINEILAPIVSTETRINMNYNGKRIKIGVGVHDSSAALLPYIRSVKKKFILVSTGTWSIALNPFVKSNLSDSDIDNECINYMRLDGSAVKASRLFLGNEYKVQVQFLLDRYKVAENYHKSVKFDHTIFKEISFDFKPMFSWQSIKVDPNTVLSNMSYNTFEEAYHQLMLELVLLQINSIKTAIGNDKIDRVYIDGGFSDNDLYVSLLTHYLRDMKIHTTDSSLGSALGSALCISDSKLNSKFLKETYSLKKHLPFISKIN
jgi:sugar (pentulose or hexulose) kinase